MFHGLMTAKEDIKDMFYRLMPAEEYIKHKKRVLLTSSLFCATI